MLTDSVCSVSWVFNNVSSCLCCIKDFNVRLCSHIRNIEMLSLRGGGYQRLGVTISLIGICESCISLTIVDKIKVVLNVQATAKQMFWI